MERPPGRGRGDENRLLTAMADSLVEHTAEILTCNEADLEAARGHISDVMLDRLRLDPRAAAVIPGTPAGPADFDTEFLDLSLIHI